MPAFAPLKTPHYVAVVRGKPRPDLGVFTRKADAITSVRKYLLELRVDPADVPITATRIWIAYA
jgi:hypothetical protein